MMFNKILIAIDGSEDSDKALEAAADLGKKYSSEIHTAFSINYQNYTVGLGVGTSMMIPHDELEKCAETLLQKSRDKLHSMGCSPSQEHILDGDPGRAITDLAKEIDVSLIICGSRGHSDLSSLLIGSVSHKICNLAHCPCLVAR